MAGEQQHYVPQFLLKNFIRGKKPKIFVYDKWKDNVFSTNIRNVAAENGFYDIEFEKDILTIEPDLARLDSSASKTINKLLLSKKLTTLDENDIAIAAIFLAVQFVRTKEHRIRFREISRLFDEKIRELGFAGPVLQEESVQGNSIRKDKLFGIKSLLGVSSFVPHFLNKDWAIFETTRKYPLYISDNPLTLHNQMDFGLRGNIGLAVKGIEIYFPISSSMCLGLLCPSIGNEFRLGHENFKLIDKMGLDVSGIGMKNPEAARSYCDCLVNGTPIKLFPENVTMFNSLQVMYSTRFVYCEDDDFELVRRMIKDNSKFRHGMRPKVS